MQFYSRLFRYLKKVDVNKVIEDRLKYAIHPKIPDEPKDPEETKKYIKSLRTSKYNPKSPTDLGGTKTKVIKPDSNTKSVERMDFRDLFKTESNNEN